MLFELFERVRRTGLVEPGQDHGLFCGWGEGFWGLEGWISEVQSKAEYGDRMRTIARDTMNCGDEAHVKVSLAILWMRCGLVMKIC